MYFCFLGFRCDFGLFWGGLGVLWCFLGFLGYKSSSVFGGKFGDFGLKLVGRGILGVGVIQAGFRDLGWILGFWVVCGV